MNIISATTGNSGPKIRSDCELTLELRSEGGISMTLNSKVQALYGESIISQCKEILAFFGIKDAYLKIDDSGALPFVISARLEAAVRKLIPVQSDYLPEFLEENKYSTLPGRGRITRLYLPGNMPGMMINAGLHSADGLILDLEDSVAPEKKDEARILVRNALRQIGFNGAERMVRINQGEMGLKDLEYVIPQNVNLVLIPKCESPESVRSVEIRIGEIRERSGITNPVYLMPIIESAKGVEMAYDIARSSGDVVAMAVGLEDLTADLGVARTEDGIESLYARMRIVNAAKAAGIQPIDSVFSDVANMDALRQNVRDSRALGFEGMGCIHPRQIAVIRQGFAPTSNEIEKSRKILIAYNEARAKGQAVAALGSKMIDPPVAERAGRTIDLAVRMGLLPANWMDEKSE
ncbi:MAG: aldolase/citrate lyase family protein [Bacteroidota bacterium]|nr:aldolase/citrate lyase family protein [Bacteroidota bacterium]